MRFTLKRPILFATWTVLVLCLDLPAQTWVRKNDFPGAGRSKGLSFSIGNQGYYGSGAQSGGDTILFRKYDPKTDSWTALPSLPVNTLVTDAIGIGNFGYAGLGYSGGFPVRKMFRYDPSSNSWTSVSSYPVGPTTHTATCTLGGKAYLFGGLIPNSPGAKDTCFSYDPISDNWAQLAPLPTARALACGFSVNGFCYATLGRTPGDSLSKSIYQYNPVSNTWLRKSDYPGFAASSSGYGHFVLNNEVYFCNDSSQLWRYTPATDQWKRLSDMPFRIGGGSFVLNGIAYVIPEGTTQVWQFCPPMIVNAGSDARICKGASTQLHASGGSNYAWSPASGLSNPNIANPLASPADTLLYKVIVTDTNGCSASDSVKIFVRPLPSIHVSALKVTLCAGDTTSLNATGATSYNWLPLSGLSSSSVSNPKAWPSGSMTYVVTGMDSVGCSNKDSLTLTVNPNPVAAALSHPPFACKGDTCVLYNTVVDSTASYFWSPSSTLIDSSGNYVKAFPATTTTYTLHVQNSYGCRSKGSITVQVHPLPILIATVSPGTICSGDSARLSVSGAATYFWNPSASVVGSFPGSSVQAFPTSSTIYQVRGIDSNRCSNTAFVSLQVKASPHPPQINVNILVLSSDATTGNQWYLNGVAIPGATMQTDTAKVNGIYSVCTSNALGCKACSAPLSFNALGEDEHLIIRELNLFPNPSQSACTLYFMTNKKSDLDISVYNATGSLIKCIYKGISLPGPQEFELNTRDLAEGIYLVRLVISDGILQKKLIILR
jgi:N-acetylneuraminic acid mutarotase